MNFPEVVAGSEVRGGGTAEASSAIGPGALLDAMSAMVLVLDPQSRLVFANRAFEETFGRSGVDLVGKPVSEVVPFPPLSGREFQSFETGWPGDEGHRVLLWSCRPVVDANGEPRLIVCTGADLSQERRAQHALGEQRDFLQTLLDRIPNPVFYENVDGIYLGCNEAFSRWIGLPRESIVGASVGGVSPPELADTLRRRDLDLFENPGVQIFETTVRTADGDLREVVFYKAAYADRSGKVEGLIGVILEITERKRAERALEEARNELEARVKQRTAELERVKDLAEAANRALSEFLNIASHELRTPLTSLILTTERAHLGLAKGQPVDEAMLKSMERHIYRLSRLTGHILDVSRLERGVLPLHRVLVELGELAIRTVQEFRLLAPQRQISVSIPEAQVWVEADSIRIEQVLTNLLDNAARYSPPGTAINVELRCESMTALLSVGDLGPGIPADRQTKIFERYFRKDSDQQQAGMGLGLYIAREIARGHGGEIDLQSGPDGNTFTLRLPLLSGTQPQPTLA